MCLRSVVAQIISVLPEKSQFPVAWRAADPLAWSNDIPVLNGFENTID